MTRRLAFAALAALVCASASAEELRFRQRLLGDLIGKVPGILKTYDPKTGRFGQGIWICQDQQAMYPLAVAYATAAEGNPYHKDAKLLEVIMKAGDALIADMDAQGRWMFRKKDGSTWGLTHMPWTYSRWIRTFALVRDEMPAARREAWDKALTLGYTGIARGSMGHVHNIPTHHAMGLYAAGKLFGRPEWCHQAAAFMAKVLAVQSDAGYWSEGGGPVVLYDFVYLDAVGTYYAMSGDRSVLPALARGARFHARFTYPSGQSVETIDQRNPYHETIEPGNVGFTFSAEGRAYLAQQWKLLGGRLGEDLIASLVLYGEEGPLPGARPADADDAFVLVEKGADRAATVRRSPWLVCLSAYTSPVAENRWHQDRQNFVSVWHQKSGLIVGGGNTKLQPGWSTFTVGDERALAHRPGDTRPKFLPQGTLYHVPSAAVLRLKPEPGLELTYGPELCRVTVRAQDARSLVYEVECACRSGLPVAAHVTLLARPGTPLSTGAGRKLELGDKPLELGPAELGGWVRHDAAVVRVPASATLRWPVLPHNPYRADGRATASEGRLAIRIPLSKAEPSQRVVLEIP